MLNRREFVRGVAAVGAATAVGGLGSAWGAMRSGPAGERRARRPGAPASPTGSLPATRGPDRSGSGRGSIRSSARRRSSSRSRRDADFRHVVERRRVVAKPGRDYTVHVRVKGLRPGERYWYRFDAGERSSSVGRFRTLPPADSRQPIRIGIFSCQD